MAKLLKSKFYLVNPYKKIVKKKPKGIARIFLRPIIIK